MTLHFAWLYGIEGRPLSQELAASAYLPLVQQSSLLVGSARRVTAGYPDAANPDDPVAAWVEGLFLSLRDQPQALRRMRACAGIAGLQPQAAMQAFAALIHGIAGQAGCGESATQTVLSAAIAALKRALVPAFYYKVRLDRHIFHVLEENTVAQWEGLIDEAIGVADWAFAPSSQGHSTLYRGNGVHMYMDHQSGRCHLADQGAWSGSAAELMPVLAAMEAGRLVVCGFDFLPYLQRVLSVLTTLEDPQHG